MQTQTRLIFKLNSLSASFAVADSLKPFNMISYGRFGLYLHQSSKDERRDRKRDGESLRIATANA